MNKSFAVTVCITTQGSGVQNTMNRALTATKAITAESREQWSTVSNEQIADPNNVNHINTKCLLCDQTTHFKRGSMNPNSGLRLPTL